MQHNISNPPNAKSSKLEALALRASQRIGSPTSLAIHTLLFIGIFAFALFGFSLDQILLILTTLVSLEAIYLAIFIQMTVNQHARQIEEVSEDVGELGENMEEISKDVDHLHENIEEIGEDVEEISKDIDSIQEDVKEIGEDVEEISEDVEELGEEIEKDDREDDAEQLESLKHIDRIENSLQTLLQEIQAMKRDRSE
ncbi:MAG: hypothetical protein QG581_109 [Patescibacteria group bacterium]|jgi:uncharacterized protein YoxC|nr:hypothetical protein [Patescibacteria group bacterium]MDQ5961188.1 hypothetical protein [Patescibacteria group bacterium]